MPYEIELCPDPSQDDMAAIVAPLVEHNRQQAPPPNHQPLALLLRDAGGNTVGGLWGRSGYDWLFIDYLAVPLEGRGKGVGTALIQKAELIAIERGCIGIWLDTFQFQARGFYEKLGYTVFGKLDDYPSGSARYFLQKRIA